jgi:hypothetical protein
MSIIVFAFHYNRGPSLQNLVDSVERHVEAPLIVMDDRSDDPGSLDTLARIARRHEVIVADCDSDNEWRTGGLHANMSRAMAIAADRKVDIALFLQDDMQVVRDIRDDDITLARAGFERENASCVIQTCFLKSSFGVRADDGAMREVMPGLYERSMTPQAVRAHKTSTFSDTGFFSVPLFESQIGNFLTGEQANQRLLEAQGVRIGFFAAPFMHWCPMPISYRSRSRSWRNRIADRIAGAGTHPIQSLEGSELIEFLERDYSILPYAEDFLTAPTLPPCNYWSLEGGIANLQSRGGWRRRIAKILRVRLR